MLTSAHLCIYSVMAVDVCQELPISLPTAVFSPFICLALHESVPSGNRAVLHPSYQHSTWLKQLVMFSWGTCGDKEEWDPPRVHMQHMLCFTSVAEATLLQSALFKWTTDILFLVYFPPACQSHSQTLFTSVA